MTVNSGQRPRLRWFVEDAVAERSTGKLDIEAGQASLYFFLGRPVHAVVAGSQGQLVGEPALDAIITTYGNATRARFEPGEVPAYTLECTVDELQTRITDSGPSGADDNDTPRSGVDDDDTPSGERQQFTIGQPGYQPLLPRGTALFDAIPLGALVIEALAPTLKNGAIMVTHEGDLGVVLVAAGKLGEVVLFRDGERLLGGRALEAIRGLEGAIVSAYRLSSDLIEVAPALLRGEASYRDLRLAWTDWKLLISDLSTREGVHVVELETPRGRGVTCIRDGRQIGTYTDGHPELGDITLLDGLIGEGDGVIWVRSRPQPIEETAATASDPTRATGDTSASSPLPVRQSSESPAGARPPQARNGGPPAAPSPSLLDMEHEDAGLDTAFSDIFNTPAANPQAPVWPPVAPTATVAPGSANPAAAWPPQPGAAAPGNGTAGGGQPPSIGTSVITVLPQLQQIARKRLGRSAARVEAMLDEASKQGRPMEAVMAEVRGLTIRGVMQTTLDEVVDEMMSVAKQHS